MGFCYDRATRQLCCDACGAHGGVRKKRCPAGWCQATALCATCRKNPEIKTRIAESHAGCAESSAYFAAQEAKVEALKAAGEYVFCASVYEGDGVRVWFRSEDGSTKTELVSREVRETLDRFSTHSALSTEGALA